MDKELKTLKDFNHGEYCPQCKLSIPIFDVEGFRAEAIKLAKEFGSSHICECCAKWLDFLNIKDKELK